MIISYYLVLHVNPLFTERNSGSPQPTALTKQIVCQSRIQTEKNSHIFILRNIESINYDNYYEKFSQDMKIFVPLQR